MDPHYKSSKNPFKDGSWVRLVINQKLEKTLRLERPSFLSL